MGFSVREWGDPVRQSEEFGMPVLKNVDASDARSASGWLMGITAQRYPASQDKNVTNLQEQ